MNSKEESLRKRVYQFYFENYDKKKNFTVKHFAAEKVPKSTIYSIIKRAESNYSYNRAVGSGKKAKIMTKAGIKRLCTLFDHKCNISHRQAARKMKCHHTLIGKVLKKYTNIKCRKKTKIPKRTEEQKAKIRIRCSRLFRKLAGNSIIMDDESYFTLAHTSINGNSYFYSSNIEETPSSVKFSPTAKFNEKILVWICISNCGMSQPYFTPSGMAINQKVYLEECIIKRLMPFINKYHSDGKYLFWPDLASAHYAKIVTSYFIEKKINYVQKWDNPPNLPECRPIENFWSILKGLVYKNNWQAQNLDQLKKRIKYCLSLVDKNLIHRLCHKVPSLIDNVRRNGVIENS